VSTQGTARDLTEQRAAEKLIEVQRQQLIQADKLSSLGTLVAGVAHEINSPNHAIRSYSRRIGQAWESIVPVLDAYYKESGDFLVGGVEYTEMREDMGGYIDDLGKCSSRINRIVEDLKGFYRQGALEMARISVNHVVGSAVTLMGSYIDDHTSRFTADLGEAIPDIDGDFQTLEQVIVNLLTNACQSLEDRGRAITLTTSLRECDGSVVIETKDEGVGIPRDHLDKLTNPFFSTNRDSGGTGLGLSISNAIINAHGGALSIASELGKGTVVEIRLPVDSDATGRA
jgi:two-component system, NtrC family, sensor kinase